MNADCTNDGLSQQRVQPERNCMCANSSLSQERGSPQNCVPTVCRILEFPIPTPSLLILTAKQSSIPQSAHECVLSQLRSVRGVSLFLQNRYVLPNLAKPRDDHILCSNMAFNGGFTPVLAKHSKSFSLIDCVSVGVDRMQRNFAKSGASSGLRSFAIIRRKYAQPLP